MDIPCISIQWIYIVLRYILGYTTYINQVFMWYIPFQKPIENDALSAK